MANNDDRLNPQSGSGSGWFQENFASIVLPILAIVVLVGGLYLYTTGRDSDTTDTRDDTDVTAEVSDTDDSDIDSESGASEGVQNSEEGDVVVLNDDKDAGSSDDSDQVIVTKSTDGGSITVTARAGDGVTHLARRALAEYLNTNAQNDFTPQHKVYAEDYMQNRTGSQGLHIGDQLTFSNSLLGDAVSSARMLTDAQLANLTKYAQRAGF